MLATSSWFVASSTGLLEKRNKEQGTRKKAAVCMSITPESRRVTLGGSAAPWASIHCPIYCLLRFFFLPFVLLRIDLLQLLMCGISWLIDLIWPRLTGVPIPHSKLPCSTQVFRYPRPQPATQSTQISWIPFFFNGKYSRGDLHCKFY